MPGAKQLAEQLAKEQKEKEEQKIEEVKFQTKDSIVLSKQKQESPLLEKETDIALDAKPETSDK